MEPIDTRVVIVGGGAAGVFAAITCAEASPATKVIVLEKGPQFLSKVLISGGGRCNVTNACFDPQRLAEFYPRGGRELIGPFHTFQPRDTQTWFESRGVKLKAEPDGRMFPATDSSRTIVNSLLDAARKARVEMICGKGVEQAQHDPGGGFRLTLGGGETLRCGRVMLATGGCRTPTAGRLAVSLGHTLAPPVPSLFAFKLDEPWLKNLAGVSVQDAEITVPGHKLRQKGALLITHEGISGPAVLKASAWGARQMHELNYRFVARINWIPSQTTEQVLVQLQALKTRNPSRGLARTPPAGFPSRLWEALAMRAGIPSEMRWADLSRGGIHTLVQQLTACELRVVGKSLNKDEFVTCGGVVLREVNFKTMESRVCPGLFFGGELLDIDGITGGFNFQAAWTTGWIAGKAMSR